MRRRIQSAETFLVQTRLDGNEASLPIVEARGLTGDTVFLEDCATKGNIMAKISLRRKRLAAHVVVMDPSGRHMADNENATLPMVQFVIINEDDAVSAESARQSLRLYAQLGDVVACGHALEMLADAGESAYVLAEALANKEASWRTAVETLMRLGAPLGPAFAQAACCGDCEGVKFLLSIDPAVQVDGYFENGMTALTLGADNGQLEVVEMLLSRGAADDHRDKFRSIALIVAAENGHLEVVKILLAAGSAVDHQKDRYGSTIQITPAQKGHLETAEALLSTAPAVEQQDKFGKKTALIAAAKNGQLEVVEALLSAGAAVDHRVGRGTTALILAAGHGHLEVVQALLSAGADIDLPDDGGKTPLIWAAKYGKLDLVKILLSAGSAVDQQDGGSRTALFWAKRAGHVGTMKVIREASSAKSH